MPFNDMLMEELNMLLRFNPTNHQSGIKVHKSAAAHHIAAIKRLHQKGLVTQADGGYLTELGVEAVDNVHDMLSFIRPEDLPTYK